MLSGAAPLLPIIKLSDWPRLLTPAPRLRTDSPILFRPKMSGTKRPTIPAAATASTPTEPARLP